MGPWNVVTALLIAVAKALLVILFFMHVRHSSKLTWIFAGAAFLWLTLLLGLTLSEYWFRPARTDYTIHGSIGISRDFQMIIVSAAARFGRV